MHRKLESSMVLALAMAGAVLAASPVIASATRLGNPTMEVLTAKITPPYSSDFNLSTGVSSWPPIADVTFLREFQKDTTGKIQVDRVFNQSPPCGSCVNSGSAMAKDSGVFYSSASAHDQFSYADHVGVFSFTQWSQSFRKDSVDATYRFTISGARLYARCLTSGARAEFAANSSGLAGGVPFYAFHQDAGVKLTGAPPFPPTVAVVSHGPMSYSESNPDGIGRDHEMVFGGITENVDLSSIPVGAEFTIIHSAMTQASIQFDDVVAADAFFRDPVNDSIGVVIEVTGLTPTDNPQLPTVAVGQPTPDAPTRMSAARPNPARGAVSFTLELPAAGELTADVFDLSGRHVTELARGVFAAGTHSVTWDARDENGARTPAGLYFVRARGAGIDQVRRVVRIAGN